MKLFVLKVVFAWALLLSISSVSYAEDIVASIVIEGNRYVESPAILEKITSKVGEPLNKRQLSRDVQKLFATGFFLDMHVEGERSDAGIKLIFVVEENPVIASVKIEGNDEVADKKLRPGIKIKPGFIMGPKVEFSTLNSIRKVYLEKGYYQVKVDIKTTTLNDGRVDVVINVKEGEITHIKEIRFVGNDSIPSTELYDIIASRESNFGSWFSSNDVFNKGRFEADSGMVQQHYQDAGYLDVRIESTRLMLTPDRDNFYLALSIYEGPIFTVSAIELQGDIVPSSEALREKVNLKVGELYSVTKLRKSLADLTEVIGNEGYAFANVTPMFHRNIENNTVVVTFDLEKGKEVYVERINISGNAKTKDHVLRRELRQSEGARYNAADVRRSKERLARLSYIKNARFSNDQGSADGQAKMNIDLEEGSSGSFSAGVSYSQLYGVGFTGKVEEKNLFGEGYRANVSADIGGATTNYSVNLVDPYFLSEDVSASVSVFRTQTDLQSYLAYKQDSGGGSVGLSFALNEYARYAVSYSQVSTSITDVLDPASFLKAQEGTSITGELTQSLSFDTRDRVISPTAGGLHKLTFGYAGLTGEEKFYETGFSTQEYVPLTDFWTLRGSFGASMIKGYGGLDAPLYRRYSLGGVGSLRGYDSFGVSIVDGTQILGGDYKSTASLDLIFPLPYMETAGFRGAFFVDGGTIWGSYNTISEPLDTSKIRGSYGFGIEWASPVGPITMIWAKAVNAQADDKVRAFEFSLGRGF